MTQNYTDLRPTFPDQHSWTAPRVLRHQAARRPNSIFLATPEEGREWTYSALLDSVTRVATSLTGSGARPGDRVLVMAGNSSQFIRSWLGSAFASLVMVPINVDYEGEFLAHPLSVAGARWAIIDDVFAARFVASAGSARTIERFWVIDTGTASQSIDLLRRNQWTAEPWESLEEASAVTADADPEPHHLAAILFTSGTTGPSKGVAMPHAQMYFFADCGVSLTRLTSDDTYLTLTPLFHGNALFLAAYPALIAGARLVVRSRFSASRWIDDVRGSGATVTNLVGVMMDFVWKSPRRPDDAQNALRCVFAAPTASSLVDGYRERFGIEAAVELFGLTETGAPILAPYGHERPAGAAGLHASEWFDIRLVDPENDAEVPIGQIGELVVRPRIPWICSLGYYGMPERTVEAWRNLWFHTGDALRRDEDGWYYFVDRFKDALRRRGENISSYEVEQAILQHPSIEEVAVVGVPSDIEAGEQEVLAVVVRSDDVAAADLWAWCDQRVPAFAIPRFLRFVDALPKTPSAKVRKQVLREVGVTSDTYDRARVGAHAKA